MLKPAALLSCLPMVLLCSLQARAQQQAGPLETPQEMLSAQVRLHGFVCEKAHGAARDKRRSRADRAVWVLKCSNASYRVSRSPDMTAEVEPLP